MSGSRRRQALPPIVYCVGVGLGGTNGLTLQAVETLEGCRRIYFTTESAFVQGGSSGFLRAQWINLSDHLVYGERRTSIYRRMAKIVADGARESRSAAWLTRGHPGLVCGVTAALRRESTIAVQIVGGMSTIDYCLSAVGKLSDGNFIVCNGRDVAAGVVNIAPEIPMIILQCSRAQTDLCPGGCSPKAAAYQTLLARLRGSYASTHSILLLEVADSTGAQVRRVSLGRLDTGLRQASSNVTLVVPASQRRGRVKANWRSSMDSLGELFQTPLERLIAQA